MQNFVAIGLGVSASQKCDFDVPFMSQKKQIKTNHMKGTSKSHFWEAETPKPIATKFFMSG